MRVEILASTVGGLLEAELVQHRRDRIGRRRLLDGAAQVGDRGVRGTPGVSLACRGPQDAEPLGVTGAGIGSRWRATRSLSAWRLVISTARPAV
jgi:hypothetical protein